MLQQSEPFYGKKDFLPCGRDISLQLDYGNKFIQAWSSEISIPRWAVDAGHLSLIELLLKSGDVDASELDEIGYPWWPQLVTAIKSQDVDTVKDILESSQLCYIKLHRQSFLGDSLLDIAASHSNEDVIKALVKAGCSTHNSILDAKEPVGPWRVCSKGHSKAVETLLVADFRILAVKSPDPCYKCSPIDVAVRAGHVDAVKQLLALPEIDLNLKQRTGRSLLTIAIESNHSNVLKILLGDDRIDVNEPNERGQTPLKQASIEGGLSDSPSTMSPLHRAVMLNLPTMVMQLISSPGVNANSFEITRD